MQTIPAAFSIPTSNRAQVVFQILLLRSSAEAEICEEDAATYGVVLM